MNNIGYIICESATTVALDKFKIVRESTQSNHRVIGEGSLQTANERNRNGRWYSDTELFPQLKAPRTVELLNAGYLRAECGHPLSKELARQQTIDGKLCCAQFLKIWVEGMDVMAQFKGTNNDLGREFDDDLRDGCLPAWSLRALGTIENTNRGAEVRNLKVITWDNVIYPSHPGAYTKRLVTESTDELIEGNYTRRPMVTESSSIYVSREETGVIIPINNASVASYIKAESCNFKKIVESFDCLYDTITLVENGTKVQMTDKVGDTIVVNLENYIHNEIMNYCEHRA